MSFIFSPVLNRQTYQEEESTYLLVYCTPTWQVSNTPARALLPAEFALLAGLGRQSADFCTGVTYDVDVSTNTFNKKAFEPSDANRYKDFTTKFNVKSRPCFVILVYSFYDATTPV